MCGVITNPRLNSNGNFFKPSLKLGHPWMSKNIAQFYTDVITYPHLNLMFYLIQLKWDLGTNTDNNI